MNKMAAIAAKSDLDNGIKDFIKYTKFLDGYFEKTKEKINSNPNYHENDSVNNENSISIKDIVMAINYESPNSIFRKSTIIAIYAFAERHMQLICHLAKLLNENNSEITNLEIVTLYKARQNLEKKYSYDYSPVKHEWGCINDLTFIRHCLVHNDGDINYNNDKDKIISIVDKYNGLSLSNDRYIKIEHDYIDLVLKNIQTFFAHVSTELFSKSV